MPTWKPVTIPRDGQPMEEGMFADPLRALAQRTDVLKLLLDELVGNAPLGSLRKTDCPLSEVEDLEPAVGDVVVYDSGTGTYVRAIAGIRSDDAIIGLAESCAGIGVLTYKDADAATGTVVFFGYMLLETEGEEWTLANLMESGELFRAGPMYLSASERGKLTPVSPGVSVRVGHFYPSTSGAATGGTALVSPGYAGADGGHVHRPVLLGARPAGDQLLTGSEPDQTHQVIGFRADDFAEVHGVHAGSNGDAALTTSVSFMPAGLIGLTVTNVTTGKYGVITNNDTSTITATLSDGGTWGIGDEYSISERTRLHVGGTYTGVSGTTYTLVLKGTVIEASGTPDYTDPPVNGSDGFEEVFLHWTSDDDEEGKGEVRITSYEKVVSFGTKGCTAWLENVNGDAATPRFGLAESDADMQRRTWTVTVPDNARGWTPHRVRAMLTPSVDTNDFSVLLFGGPHAPIHGRAAETIKVAFGKLYALDWTGNPSDADTVTVAGTVFEFDNNDSYLNTSVPVQIETLPADTYKNLVNAIANTHDTGSRCHAALFAAADRALVVVPASLAVSESAANLGVTNIDDGADGAFGTAKLLVYDADHNALAPGATLAGTNGYWSPSATYYTPVPLLNGLRLMIIPFAADDSATTDTDVVSGDTWTHEFVNEAVGATFSYNVGMHASLLQLYPAVPMDALEITLNGVAQVSQAVSPDDYVFKSGTSTLYWMLNRAGMVPWPLNWTGTTHTPDDLEKVTAVAYVTRARGGPSDTVTSLRARAGGLLQLFRAGTNDPATTGDLEADFQLSMLLGSSNVAGHIVLKDMQGGKFRRGPVVERITQGPGISITSKEPAAVGQGTVHIALDSAGGYGGAFDNIDLEGARQDRIGMFGFIKLLEWDSAITTNLRSGFTAYVQVPYALTGSYRMAIYATVFGTTNVAATAGHTKYAGLKFSYNVLRDQNPTADTSGTLVDNLIAPSAPRQVVIELGNTANDPIYKPYDPLLTHNDPSYEAIANVQQRAFGELFPQVYDLKAGVANATLSEITIRGGSLVAIRIERADLPATYKTQGREYAGALGFINLRWQLYASS